MIYVQRTHKHTHINKINQYDSDTLCIKKLLLKNINNFFDILIYFFFSSWIFQTSKFLKLAFTKSFLEIPTQIPLSDIKQKQCHSIQEVLVRLFWVKFFWKNNLRLLIFFLLTLKAVKRLLKEAQELKNPTELFFAQPLDVSYFLRVLAILESKKILNLYS